MFSRRTMAFKIQLINKKGISWRRGTFWLLRHMNTVEGLHGTLPLAGDHFDWRACTKMTSLA
jgi:hypothetical protein